MTQFEYSQALIQSNKLGHKISALHKKLAKDNATISWNVLLERQAEIDPFIQKKKALDLKIANYERKNEPADAE